jgi:flagellar biosynthesis GTPase FlhF
VFPSKEKINESDVIFVTGFAGVGKTTLSSKIVSYLLDNKTYMNETKNISLINFSNKSANNMTDLINFGRLLNVKVHSLSNINDLKKFLDANRNRKLIVDVSREFIMNEDFMNFLEDSSENINYSLILTIQANANRRTISDQMDLFRNLQPIIALTKLDESYVGSEELSIFAEINSKIGLLSSSKNIIDALAFAKDEILAQYMKEM